MLVIIFNLYLIQFLNSPKQSQGKITLTTNFGLLFAAEKKCFPLQTLGR
jgi:hypothetical protein